MKKTVSLLVVLGVLLLLFCSCSDEPEEAKSNIRVGVMRGATALGMLPLMDEAPEGYEFDIKSEAAAFVSALYKKEIDIAAVPSNLAALIYNNGGGNIKMLAVNTLNVLYIVERGSAISSISDLSGKKLYATGEAAVPEYVLRNILDKNGLTGERAPEVQWCSETTEVLAYLSADENAVALLPQPFVSVAQLKLGDIRVALDMSEEWKRLEPESEIVTGVLVAGSEFVSEHPEKLSAFLEAYEKSVLSAESDIEGTAALAEKYEIINAKAAEKAIPNCGICYIDGSEMMNKTNAFLSVLYKYDPKSIGGKLPDGGFYYE